MEKGHITVATMQSKLITSELATNTHVNSMVTKGSRLMKEGSLLGEVFCTLNNMLAIVVTASTLVRCAKLDSNTLFLGHEPQLSVKLRITRNG